ncbi:hypothetical protein DYH09_00400 [bacterium CPR1]|nr:hypothetical protein [bacterium CPR1]
MPESVAFSPVSGTVAAASTMPEPVAFSPAPAAPPVLPPAAVAPPAPEPAPEAPAPEPALMAPADLPADVVDASWVTPQAAGQSAVAEEESASQRAQGQDRDYGDTIESTSVSAPTTSPGLVISEPQPEEQAPLPEAEQVAAPPSGPPGTLEWRVWSEQERAFVDTTLRQQIYDPGLGPAQTWIERILHYCRTHTSGYLLVDGDEGVGKSLLSEAILVERAAGRFELAVGRYSIQRGGQDDYSTLIEVVNEFLRLNLRCANAGLRTLDLQVTRDYQVRYRNRRERFAAFLLGLAQVNGGRLMLMLDGLDEVVSDTGAKVKLADFLPATLPQGVYVLLTYERGRIPESIKTCLAELGEPFRLSITMQDNSYQEFLHAWLSRYVPLSTPQELQTALVRAQGRLGVARQMADLLQAGFFTNASELPTRETLYPELMRQFERHAGPERFRAQFLHFFLLLSADYAAITLEDLACWGVEVDTIFDVLRICPSLLLMESDWTGPTIALAHDSLRRFLWQSYPEESRQIYRSLSAWMVESILAPESKGEPDVGRSKFARLYEWTLAARDPELAESVARSRGLSRLRISSSNELESKLRFHQKVCILDSWKNLLEYLVLTESKDEYREELGWAYSSRGLTYLRMGQFERALEDIGEAITLFVPLIEDGQDQLRNGLAAAYNRRSEACRYLGNFELALADASQAVTQYTTVVEQFGRADLRNLLGMAYQNRAVICRHYGDLITARGDCNTAIELYEQLLASNPRVRQDLASCYHTRGVVSLALGECEPAVLDSGRAIEHFTELVDRQGRTEFANELAAAHNNRGGAYHRLGQAETALVDYGRAINIRRDLVNAGRLDLRNDLALTHTNRGMLTDYLGKRDEALVDYAAAIELRRTLVEVEQRNDLAADLAQTHTYRGATLRALKRIQDAVIDYNKAVDIYTRLIESRPTPELLRQLALAHNSLGLIYLDQGELQKAADSCTRALEINESLTEEDVGQELRVDRAVARNNRGEAHRRAGAFHPAFVDYSEAVEAYTHLIAEGRRDLMRDLALSQNNRARVALVLGDGKTALHDSSRALEIFIYLIEQQGRGDLLPHLGVAYSNRGAAQTRLNAFEKGLTDLGRAIDLYRLLIEDSGRNEFFDELALAYRRRAKALLELGKQQATGSSERMVFPKQALEDFTQAVNFYEQAVKRDQGGPYQIELVRTQILRTELHEELGDVNAALKDAGNAVDYFAARMAEADYTTVRDLLAAFKRRAEIYMNNRQNDEAMVDFGRLINLCVAAMERDSASDYRPDLAEAYNNRAWTRSIMGQIDESLKDFAQSLDIYGQLVIQEKRFEYGDSLAWTYNNRATTLKQAGQHAPALKDYSDAIEIYNILVGQGRDDLSLRLSTALLNRGLLHQDMGSYDRAMADMTRAVELRIADARREPTPAALAEVASGLSTRGLLNHHMGNAQGAMEDYQGAISFYSDLVESRGRQDLAPELGRALVARSMLGIGPGQDDQAFAALTRAIQVVNKSASLGHDFPASFPVHFLKAAATVTSSRDINECLDLLTGISELFNHLLERPRLVQDWGAYAEALTELSARVPADRRSSLRGALLALAVVYALGEVETQGNHGLPTLVRALHRLGEALERSKVPGNLSKVGLSFKTLMKRVPDYRGSEDFRTALEAMVRLWQALPAAVPAHAQVSRFDLAHLLKTI